MNPVREAWLKALKKEGIKFGHKFHLEFCWNHAYTNHSTNSAIKAGYSQKSAAAAASRALTNVKIVRAIELCKNEIAKVRGVANPEQTLIGITKDGFFDPAVAFNEDGSAKSIHDVPKDIRICINGLKMREKILIKEEDEKIIERVWEYRFVDKLKAKELLAKHHNLFEQDNKSRQSLPELLKMMLEALGPESRRLIWGSMGPVLSRIGLSDENS